MSKELTLSDIYSSYLDEIEDLRDMVDGLQGQLKEEEKTRHDLELIIKRLKRRSICDKQKAKDRKAHITELIAQVAELKKNLKLSNKLLFKWYEGCCEAKHQLYDANQIISEYRCYDDTEFGKATEYCKKWDVK